MLLSTIKTGWDSEMKEKLLCISFSACHPAPSRALIIRILIWIACWSHSSILKCRLLPEEFITLLIGSDTGTLSDSGEVEQVAVPWAEASAATTAPETHKSLQTGQGARARAPKCFLGFWGVLARSHSGWVSTAALTVALGFGFWVLSVFLVRASEAAEHFQVLNTTGK